MATKLDLTPEDIENAQRVWTSDELFNVRNEQLFAICAARAIVVEGDSNKRTLVKAIVDAQPEGVQALDAREGTAEVEGADGLDVLVGEGGLDTPDEEGQDEDAMDGSLGAPQDETVAPAEEQETKEQQAVSSPPEPIKKKKQTTFVAPTPKVVDTLHGSIDDLHNPLKG